jgi:hypothetical protein
MYRMYVRNTDEGKPSIATMKRGSYTFFKIFQTNLPKANDV